MNLFLDSLNFPVINSYPVKELDSPLTVEEITLAMRSMQNNKAPGPDGLPVEFLKDFRINCPHYCMLYITPTLRQASISLLLKKDKDPDLCSSYRPLSLINVDAKILAKALAHCLENIVPTIVSHEQTGFVKGQQLFFNVRTLLNITYSKTTTTTPEVVI